MSWKAWQAKIVVGECAFGANLRAIAFIPAGTVFYDFSDLPAQGLRHRKTIQVGVDRHVTDPGYFSFVNHSCDPTAIVDAERMVCHTARDILPGEEISYFYPATEWEMSDPFRCLCGSPDCIGVVDGAGKLPPEALAGRKLNRFIERLLRERVSKP